MLSSGLCSLRRSLQIRSRHESLARVTNARALFTGAASDSLLLRTKTSQLLAATGWITEDWLEAKQLLDEWLDNRSNASVEASIRLMDRAVQESSSVSSSASHQGILNRSTLDDLVLGWQQLYKDEANRQQLLSPLEMVIKLDDWVHRSPLSLSGKALTYLIDAACRKDQPALAEELLDRLLPSDFTPSAGSIQQILASYVRVGQIPAAERLLDRMVDKGIPLNIPCYNALLLGYARQGLTTEAETLLDEICRGQHPANPDLPVVQPEVSTFNVVLSAWSQSPAEDAAERAAALLDRLYDPFDYGATGVRPNEVTMNTVLLCWARSARSDAGDRAAALLADMKEWSQSGGDMVVGKVAYATVADAYAKQGQPEQAEAVLEAVYQLFMEGATEVRPNLHMITPVLQAWAKSRREDRVERAYGVFSRIKELAQCGILSSGPDETVYNIMLKTLADHAVKKQCVSTAQRAEALFGEMKEETSVRPAFATYSILIHMWAQLHRQGGCKRAAELLKEADAGVTAYVADARTIDSIIRTFCRAGRIAEATRILEQQVTAVTTDKTRQAPHISSFGSVVAAYRMSRDPEAPTKAESIVRRLQELHMSGFVERGPDYLIYRALLACWANSKSSYTATRSLHILKEMRHRARNGDSDLAPDTSDYNVVIRALSKSRKPRKAERLLQEMIRDYRSGSIVRGTPNRHSFLYVIHAWAQSDHIDAVLRIDAILEQMLILHSEDGLHVLPDTAVYNNLLTALAGAEASGNDPLSAAVRAESILHEMVGSLASHSASFPRPSPASYELVIKAWLQLGNVERAEKILRLFHQACLDNSFDSPLERPFVSVAQAWNQWPDKAHGTQRAESVRALWRCLSSESEEFNLRSESLQSPTAS